MISFLAFNRSVILLAAVLFMAAFWGIGRIPDANLQMVVFTCLTSALLADLKSFSERLKTAFLWACYSAAVQFLFSVTKTLPLMQMIFAAILSFFTFATISDYRAGCIVMLTACLAISAPPGFLPAFGRSIDIFIGLIIIMTVTALGNAGQTPGGDTAFRPVRYSPYQALILSAKLGIGMAVSELLRLQQGVWIMMTILFINMSQTPNSSLKSLAWKRIFAVPAGIITGGFLLCTLYRIDYRLIWLLPIIGASGFFILYNYGDLFLFSIIFMITLTLFADWMAGTYQRFQFWDSFFLRSTATLFGALLELLLSPEDERSRAV